MLLQESTALIRNDSLAIMPHNMGYKRGTEHRIALPIDLESSLGKPQDILVVHISGEIKQFNVPCPPLITFEGSPYTDSTGEGSQFYALTDPQSGHRF